MSYRIDLSPSGHSFRAEPGETLLNAALRQDVRLPYGCRNGDCGSCRVRIIEGEVDYPQGRPDLLSREPADSCLTCCAEARSDLRIAAHEIQSLSELQPRMMPCRVQRIEQLTADVIRVWLKLPDNQRLQFLAGQYLDFVLQDGSRRAFSIANAPHDDEFIELHIRLVQGGSFTDWVFHQMREKAILRIEAPLGSFVFDHDSDRPVLFVAGGTGFAPIKGQIEEALHHGCSRPMTLYWGARDQADLYLGRLPREWTERHPNLRFVPVLSEPAADWQGRSGWVHTAVIADHPDLSGFDLYMAGPPAMIQAGREAFLAAGSRADRMFSDSFEFAPRR